MITINHLLVIYKNKTKHAIQDHMFYSHMWEKYNWQKPEQDNMFHRNGCFR